MCGVRGVMVNFLLNCCELETILNVNFILKIRITNYDNFSWEKKSSLLCHVTLEKSFNCSVLKFPH